MSLPSIVSVPMGSLIAQRFVRTDRLMQVCWTSDLLSTGCRGIFALLVVILPRLLSLVVVRVVDPVSSFHARTQTPTLIDLAVMDQMIMYGGVASPPFRAVISEYPWWQPYVARVLITVLCDFTNSTPISDSKTTPSWKANITIS
jgi:hypothetical protein